MERVLIFLPSILAISFIALIAFIYLRWILGRFGKNLESVEWHQKNKWKVVWLIGTPTQNIYAPTLEELIFRAPIIIIFSAISPTAWIGILVSSLIFALIHWNVGKVSILEVLSAQKDNEHESDDLKEELDRLHQKTEARTLLKQKLAHVAFTFFLGILAGYYGIVYQSIWVSVAIHSLWNLVMPAIVPLLIFTTIFAIEFSKILTKRAIKRFAN